MSIWQVHYFTYKSYLIAVHSTHINVYTVSDLRDSFEGQFWKKSHKKIEKVTHFPIKHVLSGIDAHLMKA
jgi:hypothetical protein